MANTVTNMMLTTAASVTAGSFMPEKFGGKGRIPSMRTYVGLGVTFFVLASLDEYPQGSKIATPLAFAVGGTAFSVYAIPIITKLVEQR